MEKELPDENSESTECLLDVIKTEYIEAAKNDSFLFGDYDYESLWTESIPNDVL
jgi:hypothetical protein